MRKRFLKIVAAATVTTIALTLGASGAFAESDKNKADGSDLTADKFVIFVDEETMAKHNAYMQAFEEAYTKAFDEEVAKIDWDEFERNLERNLASDERSAEPLESPGVVAKRNAMAKAKAVCDAQGLHAVYELKEDTSAPWTTYRATIPTPDFNNTSIPFAFPPDYFSCVISGDGASMKAAAGYSGNFKHMLVSATYSNGEVITRRDSGTKEELSCMIPSGTLVKVVYQFNIYQGTDSTSKNLESVSITLIPQ